MPDKQIIMGVDTQTAVAIDQLGRRLDSIEIPSTIAGYQSLLDWAHQLGEQCCFGVEGTGSYGAGL